MTVSFHTRTNLLRVALELHLDLTDFTACLDTGRHKPQVQAETNAAMALGLRGTPGVVINRRTLVGALPFALFQSVIETPWPLLPSSVEGSKRWD